MPPSLSNLLVILDVNDATRVYPCTPLCPFCLPCSMSMTLFNSFDARLLSIPQLLHNVNDAAERLLDSPLLVSFVHSARCSLCFVFFA